MSERQGSVTIQSVQRALRLLSLFAPNGSAATPHRRQWSVTELAKATGLHKSVVGRLMATMTIEGFVVQDPVTRCYSVGPRSFAVGSSYEPHRVLDQIARPIMEDLTARSGCASYMGTAAGSHYVVLIGVETPRSMRDTNVGESRAYHCNAIGKILLANMSDEEIRAVLGPDPLPKLTAYTIETVDRLLAEIAEARQTGVAFIADESILGAGSVATAIRDGSGRCVAALSLLYPTRVITGPQLDELRQLVVEAAGAISQRLGATAI